MADTDPFRAYLSDLRRNLDSGIATEHTHRAALQTLLQALSHGTARALNEPRHVKCGAPDFVVTRGEVAVGYVETKDVGISLDSAERGEQLQRYRRSLSNLILTDYLEFRWYVDGALQATARLARWDGQKVARERGGSAAVGELLGDFLSHSPEPIRTPQALAERMARLTHLIRDIFVQAFEQDEASPLLKGWRAAFAQVLIADLDEPEKLPQFADMLAQTLAYGLFSARLMDRTPGFDRYQAQRLIPPTNPFLRDLFYQLTGPAFPQEPYASFVDDLVALLDNTDMDAVLADFGKRTRQEDPTVHFYETFLAAYDPQLRERRGVYYTPFPVVSYIVRSVDQLLKTHFNCPMGLADSSTITVENWDRSLTVKGSKDVRKTKEVHKVLLLDPACGTGTFLYAVVDHIRQWFMNTGNAGMWSDYVRQHLLPRIFGFELLMAPYAVAHFKLALQLAGQDLEPSQRQQWAYDFAQGERIRVFLTNALQAPHEETEYPLFAAQFVAAETNAANEVKKNMPVLVVLGNPPYSVSSSNKGDYIKGCSTATKKPCAANATSSHCPMTISSLSAGRMIGSRGPGKALWP